MDASFDPAQMTAAAADIFFKVQTVWIARDMSAARDSLTPEMYERIQGCADLKAQRRINRLENIAVHSTKVTEAWQERGQDFVTVVFTASVLDYTTDEAGQFVDGSRTEPLKFGDFWTFVRHARVPDAIPPWPPGLISIHHGRSAPGAFFPSPEDGQAQELRVTPGAALDTPRAGRAPSRSSGSGRPSSASPLGKRPRSAVADSHAVRVRSRRTRSGRERDAEVSSRTSAGAR